MHFLEYFYENIVKYDLINKYRYKNIKQLPKLQKIILTFVYTKPEMINLGSALLALECISTQKSVFTRSKVSNVSLKIRKGHPIGCKVILRKTLMYSFLANLIFLILPKRQLDNFFEVTPGENNKTFTFHFKNSLIFPELETQYQFFKNLPGLTVTIVLNSTNQDEIFFLLKSFGLPFSK